MIYIAIAITSLLGFNTFNQILCFFAVCTYLPLHQKDLNSNYKAL